MKYLSHLPLFVYLPAYYYFLRKRLTTDRLARQQTQTTKFRDSSPISTREAMSAPQSLTLLAGQSAIFFHNGDEVSTFFPIRVKF